MLTLIGSRAEPSLATGHQVPVSGAGASLGESVSGGSLGRLGWLAHQVGVFDFWGSNVVYVKGRRAGGTTGAVNRLIEVARGNPGTRHLWIDTVHRNIDRYVQRYFIPRLSGGDATWHGTTLTLKFDNGSLCDFGSAQRPATLEGWGYDYLWVNEAGIVLRDEGLYHNSLLPMLADGEDGQSFFIGAPKGAGLFRRMHQWSQDAEKRDWSGFHQGSFSNPRLNAATLERMVQEMPALAYRQEVLAEFVETAGHVFANLERLAGAAPEDAPHPGAPYVLGVDLARKEDYSVVWVGRADTRVGVFCDRFLRMPWSEQVLRVHELSARYGGAPAYVDATGIGDAVAEQLAQRGVPVVPVVLSLQTKQRLIDQLAIAIEQERLTLVPHEPTLRELAAYAYRDLPSGGAGTAAPAGQHDDCVIALALCLHGMAAQAQPFILGSFMETRESHR